MNDEGLRTRLGRLTFDPGRDGSVEGAGCDWGRTVGPFPEDMALSVEWMGSRKMITALGEK